MGTTIPANPDAAPLLPDNVIGVARSQRAWKGVKLDVAGYRCQGEGVHLLPHREQARLTIAATMAQLFAAPRSADAKAGGLAPWRLRRVIDYMEAHFPHRIESSTMAGLVDLSQAHFSRALKASTGRAPCQWQIDARIRHAQQLLPASDASLGQIAQIAGCADTVHFGRTFRKMAGMAPGAWRSARKRSAGAEARME